MKRSIKCQIYFGIETVCVLFLFLRPQGIGFYVVMVALTLCVGFGWVRETSFLKKLQESVGLMRDPEKYCECLNCSGEPLLREMGHQAEILKEETGTQPRAGDEDRQSEINSLQSQINPHFLYNTLESIRSEAVSTGCDSIASMAKSLGAFFRYSISLRETVVPVKDELENIQNYIRIQNYRFENKFSFQIDLGEEDSAALQCLIPKMTLQPIVENAIFYGLETKEGEGEVTIHVRMTQDEMILVVSDNGAGMSEEQLERLRTRVRSGGSDNKKNAEKEAHGSGIGLSNINQQIKLIFGDRYGLNLYSIEGEGTDVEVILPIRTSMEEV